MQENLKAVKVNHLKLITISKKTMKECTLCQVLKEDDEFGIRNDSGKRRNQCIKCRSAYVRQYKKDVQAGNRRVAVIDENPTSKVCRLCNQTKAIELFPLRDTRHGYRNECKDCKSAHLSQYYTDVYNEKRRIRKMTDIQFRLASNHRLYVYKAVTRFKHKKSKKSLEYLGCSTKQLVEWLEFQFHDGMSWDNYGKTWTIDHVLPLSKFDLQDEKNARIAFHWTNLQPSFDNFQKSAKIRLHEYFNVFISVHRFIQLKKLDLSGYQSMRESLCWLRAELRRGKNSPDEGGF